MNRRTARRANPSRGKCSRSQGLRAIQSRIVRTGRCSLGDSVVRDLATPVRLGVGDRATGGGRWAAPGELRSSRRSWPPPDAASRFTRNTASGHLFRDMRVTSIPTRADTARQRSGPARRRGPAQPPRPRNRYAPQRAYRNQPSFGPYAAASTRRNIAQSHAPRRRDSWRAPRRFTPDGSRSTTVATQCRPPLNGCLHWALARLMGNHVISSGPAGPSLTTRSVPRCHTPLLRTTRSPAGSPAA
jgi:hypothetical protein